MNRSLFFDKLTTARSAWDAALAEIPAERLTEPVLAGGWSAKDLIGHVLWHEREMIGMIRARALVGSPLWALTQDERNAAIELDYRDRSAAEVLAEAEAVWAELRPLLASLSDEDLNDASRFRDLTETIPGLAPWQVIASNTFEHYEDHARDIRARSERERA
jgi:hypothetical protein